MARATIAAGAIVMLLGLVGSATASPTIVQSWQPGTFPGGIAYDADRDHIWLVNNSTGELREYTRNGVLIQTMSGSLFGLHYLIGIDWHPTTMNLWICDEYDPEQVAEVTRDGTYVSGFSVDPYMADAVGLTYCTTDGNLYITDDDNHRVAVFMTDGTYLGYWTSQPCQDTDAICHVEATNTLFVGDDTNAMLYEFTLNGTLLATYDLVALLGITGVEGLSVDQVAETLFIADSSSPFTIYEVAGMWGPITVSQTSWGRIKAMFR